MEIVIHVHSYGKIINLFYVLLIMGFLVLPALATWEEWWAYSGVSGPNKWGLHKKEWMLCSRGKLQSPINIEPKDIIYDPHLKPFFLKSEKVSGDLMNTGKNLVFVFNRTTSPIITISGGPFSYNYTIYELQVHLGSSNDEGSEHTIGNFAFSAEMQIFGYNSELYSNVTQAKISPYGIAAVAILVVVQDTGNGHFDILVSASEKVRTKGRSTTVNGLSLQDILPKTSNYITYEGSLTQPGCHETVTWIVLNKPLHISEPQIETLRQLTHGEGEGLPLMENNFRPTMPVNGRLLRTNIKEIHNPDCAVKRLSFYNVNEKFQSLNNEEKSPSPLQ